MSSTSEVGAINHLSVLSAKSHLRAGLEHLEPYHATVRPFGKVTFVSSSWTWREACWFCMKNGCFLFGV